MNHNDVGMLVCFPNSQIVPVTANLPRSPDWMRKPFVAGGGTWKTGWMAFHLNANGRFNERMNWQASGRVVYDAIYDLDEFYPNDVRDDQRLEAQIRETFLDISGKWDLRIGHQHIVWGEVVGAFVADVVSARDLRDFRATDLDQVRIPQWAIRAEHFGDEFYGEIADIREKAEDKDKTGYAHLDCEPSVSIVGMGVRAHRD